MDTNKVMAQIMSDMKDNFQKELNKSPCPEHGTPPKITLKGGTISAESCCHAQHETTDAFLKSKSEQGS